MSGMKTLHICTSGTICFSAGGYRLPAGGLRHPVGTLAAGERDRQRPVARHAQIGVAVDPRALGLIVTAETFVAVRSMRFGRGVGGSVPTSCTGA